MGYRPHLQTKHVIEYGNSFNFSYKNEEIYDWLSENGVDVTGGGDCGEESEWEIEKDDLRKIPESAYRDIPASSKYDTVITAKDLRDFVKDCLAAPTGDTVYISWF